MPFFNISAESGIRLNKPTPPPRGVFSCRFSAFSLFLLNLLFLFIIYYNIYTTTFVGKTIY